MVYFLQCAGFLFVTIVTIWLLFRVPKNVKESIRTGFSTGVTWIVLISYGLVIGYLSYIAIYVLHKHPVLIGAGVIIAIFLSVVEMTKLLARPSVQRKELARS